MNEYVVKPVSQTVDRPSPPPKAPSPSPEPSEDREEDEEDPYYREEKEDTPEPVDDERDEVEPDVEEDMMVPVVDMFNAKPAGGESVSAFLAVGEEVLMCFQALVSFENGVCRMIVTKRIPKGQQIVSPSSCPRSALTSVQYTT